MDWFASVRKQAQAAVNTALHSEAAERARQLAAQATEQATAFAKEATVKAQAVAREALTEAEKGLERTLRQVQKTQTPDTADPLQYGITPELQQFVRSLTYSTFSDYPLDSLDIPANAAEQKLNSWQETHARLVLQQVPQLQDLRFVLCPKRIDEYMFWTIYFTLCKRYLPTQTHPTQQPEHQHTAEGEASSSSSAAAELAAAEAAVSRSSRPASAQHLQQQSEAAAATTPAAAANPDAIHAEAAAGAASSAAASPTGGSDSHAADSAVGAGLSEDPDLAELGDDPELDAYLQDALQLSGDGGTAGSAGGDAAEDSDLGDLDDYINKLDAEVSK